MQRKCAMSVCNECAKQQGEVVDIPHDPSRFLYPHYNRHFFYPSTNPKINDNSPSPEVHPQLWQEPLQHKITNRLTQPHRTQPGI